MSSARVAHGSPLSRGIAEQRQILPNAVLAMIIFVVAEMMFFAAMVSAFNIAESSFQGLWPPPGQPRLPVVATAINSGALLLSGLFLFRADRMLRADRARARRPLMIAIVLGSAFVFFQGMEWVALIADGLGMTTSTHSSFFYMIVGTHALHAVVALAALVYIYWQLRTERLETHQFSAAKVFWYFVVGVWPVLYATVYL